MKWPGSGLGRRTVYQSQRMVLLSRKKAESWSRRHAYRCFCSQKILKSKRERRRPKKRSLQLRTAPVESFPENRSSRSSTHIWTLTLFGIESPMCRLHIEDVFSERSRFRTKLLKTSFYCGLTATRPYHLKRCRRRHRYENLPRRGLAQTIIETPKQVLLYEASDSLCPTVEHVR